MINRLSSRSSQPLDPASADATEAAPDNAETESAGESSAEETPTLEQAAHGVISWGEQYLRQWFAGPSLDPPSSADPNAGMPADATGAGQVTPHPTDATAAMTKPIAVEPNTVVYRSEAEARTAIASTAIHYAGCGASNEREMYLDLLTGPKDSDSTREQMLQKSSCALFARGVMRKCGVQSEFLDKFAAVHDAGGGKRSTNAVQDVIHAARERNAWDPPSGWTAPTFSEVTTFPKMGDIVQINGTERGSEHVIVFTGDPYPDPDPNHPGDFLVNTAEGGQGDYTTKNDRTDAFGTPTGVDRPGGMHPPRRLRLDKQGHLWTVKSDGKLSKQVMGYADAGKLMGPYRG